MKYTWDKGTFIAAFPENRDEILVFICVMERRWLSEYGAKGAW